MYPRTATGGEGMMEDVIKAIIEFAALAAVPVMFWVRNLITKIDELKDEMSQIKALFKEDHEAQNRDHANLERDITALETKMCEKFAEQAYQHRNEHQPIMAGVDRS